MRSFLPAMVDKQADIASFKASALDLEDTPTTDIKIRLELVDQLNVLEAVCRPNHLTRDIEKVLQDAKRVICLFDNVTDHLPEPFTLETCQDVVTLSEKCMVLRPGDGFFPLKKARLQRMLQTINSVTIKSDLVAKIQALGANTWSQEQLTSTNKAFEVATGVTLFDHEEVIRKCVIGFVNEMHECVPKGTSIEFLES